MCFKDGGMRKERIQECVCFGIRASTGEPSQLRDTLDILSRFTHPSNCLSAGRISVCVFEISALLCVPSPAYGVCFCCL